MKTIPFLDALEGDAVKEFNEYAKLLHIKKGTVISSPGAACDAFPLVLSGSIRVYKIGDIGREVTLYRIEEGQSCILTTSCIITNSSFPAIAETEKSTDVFVIPASIFKKWINEYLPWRNYVFHSIGKRIEDVIETVEEVAFKRVDHRIFDLLYSRYKKEHTGILNLTHREIANEIGTAREVVSRILKDLENKGIIEMSRGQIEILLPEQLKSLKHQLM
ncbi:MAG: Crp/Fnr family transcriptional regulator [Calditrichia bacterium]